MRKYKILLLLLLLVLISISCYLWMSKKKTHLKTIETVKISNVKNLIPVNETSVQDKLKQNKLVLNKPNKPLIDRVVAFDSDPTVDAELIKINLDHCIRIMNSENYKKPIRAHRAIDKQSDYQILYEQEINTYCEELNLTHPEYMLTKEDEINILRKSVQNDSEIGMILNNGYNDIYIDREIFDLKSKVQIIKNFNPNLLFNLKSYFMPVLGVGFHNELSLIIKSNDYVYVGLVSKSAFDLYACASGARCDRYSNLVSQYCLLRNLCGDDFINILNNKMPEGIRADILLVFNHLKETFD